MYEITFLYIIGYQQCSDIPAMPANATLATNDNVYNMTGHNVTDWLVKTMSPYIKRRLVVFKVY